MHIFLSGPNLLPIRPSEFLHIYLQNLLHIFSPVQNFCRLDLQNFCRFYLVRPSDCFQILPTEFLQIFLVQNFCRFPKFYPHFCKFYRLLFLRDIEPYQFFWSNTQKPLPQISESHHLPKPTNPKFVIHPQNFLIPPPKNS